MEQHTFYQTTLQAAGVEEVQLEDYLVIDIVKGRRGRSSLDWRSDNCCIRACCVEPGARTEPVKLLSVRYASPQQPEEGSKDTSRLGGPRPGLGRDILLSINELFLAIEHPRIILLRVDGEVAVVTFIVRHQLVHNGAHVVHRLAGDLDIDRTQLVHNGSQSSSGC